MADDLNRLLIKIEADTSKLRSALADAEKGVSASSGSIERTIARNEAKWAAWSSGITGEFKKLLAGYGALAIASKALDSITDLSKIDDMASAAGLTGEAFQELAFAANQAGSSTEDLSRGLDKFSINMAQVRLNTGEFNQFLKDQAPALRVSLSATKNQSDAINVLSDFMAGLGDESQRSTVAQQAFGRASEELTGVLDKGSAALENAAEKAHEYGVVQTDEARKAAKELTEQYKALTATTESMWQSFAVNSGKALSTTLGALDEIYEATKKIVTDAFPHIGNLGSGLARHAATSVDLGGDPGPSGLLGGLSDIAGKLPPIVPPQKLRPKPNYTGDDRLASLQKQLDEAQGNIQKSLQDSYDQDLKSFQRMLDDKQISESQFAQARASLGALMTQQTKDNLGAETQLQKDYYSGIEQSIQSTFMDTFTNALEGGKVKASELFAQLLSGFAKVTTEVLVLKPLMNSLFTGSSGTNGLGGFLNGVLSPVTDGGWSTSIIPARAAGGPGNAGQPYLVGEHGPEIFTPNAGGRFMNARATSNAMGGNTYNQNIDARGADIGVLERIKQALDASDRRQANMVGQVRQAAKRFPTR